MGRGLAAALPRDGQARVGSGRALHAIGQHDDVPELLQAAGAADRVRELRCPQRHADSDPGPRHHGPGVVSGRHLGVRLDRSGASTGNRLFRPRADGLDQAGRRRVVVRVLVQRLHRELRDFARARHLRAPAQRVHFPERARRRETDSFRLPERPGSTAAGVARELRGGQGLRRPGGARRRAVARAVRRDHGHAPPGRAAAGGCQARGAAAAGDGPPARRASSRGPSQGADARRDRDRFGRRRPLKALVLVGLLSAPGSLTGQPACGQGRTWMFGPFEKSREVNPAMTPSPASQFRSPLGDSIVRWEEHATFNPAAVAKDGRVFVLYRAEDASGERIIGGHTSRIGLGESQDGLHFTRRSVPVLYPDADAQRPYEWPGGVEDPRIVEAGDGSYVLTYTQWNRDVPRLAVATSRDLVHWTKHGPAFGKAYGGKYLNLESKSGAILARVEGTRVVATKVGGTYWMYFNVPDILIATSDNLIAWTPLEDMHGNLLKVLSPRPGHFDSWLVEAGPPALLTEHGIVVMYNAGNSETVGDPTLPARIYTGGQALYDRRNPLKLVARSDAPFIQPTEDYERTGQYPEGTTFVEGLVPFDGRWYLYYGTADSRVGVAVWDPKRTTNGGRPR